MKKVISILLAVLMMFSFVTVAFAEETADLTENEANEGAIVIPDINEIDLGDYEWLLDLPFWTVGPALKFAKIALKLVNVYLKVAKIFGFVDKDLSDYVMEAIIGMVKNAENSENVEVETTAAVVF